MNEWGIYDWTDDDFWEQRQRKITEQPLDVWRWEFLRRREAYREAWKATVPSRHRNDLDYSFTAPSLLAGYNLAWFPHPGNARPQLIWTDEPGWFENFRIRHGEDYIEDGPVSIFVQAGEVAVRLDLSVAPVREIFAYLERRISLPRGLEALADETKRKDASVKDLIFRQGKRSSTRAHRSPRVFFGPSSWLRWIVFSQEYQEQSQWDCARERLEKEQLSFTIPRLRDLRQRRVGWLTHLRILDAVESIGHKFKLIGEKVFNADEHNASPQARQAYLRASKFRDEFPAY